MPHSVPLTHCAFLAACERQTLVGSDAQPWVQVRKRFDGRAEVLCGQVIELGAGDASGEWFRVRTEIGLQWFEGRNVRLCSGDDRCTCEPESLGSGRDA